VRPLGVMAVAFVSASFRHTGYKSKCGPSSNDSITSTHCQLLVCWIAPEHALLVAGRARSELCHEFLHKGHGPQQTWELAQRMKRRQAWPARLCTETVTSLTHTVPSAKMA